MVLITEQLIRKKSEHNELMISTLEEISLHQEDIEKIEHIQNWCRDLKILLLQSNLISKLENLHKLKKLEYLNLALNNIETIENLEQLESLTKLDLTLNFIGELTSVKKLQANYNLRTLILTGNPCCDFKGYRDYVLTVLPEIESLDGIDIKISERLIAKKNFENAQRFIIQAEAEYKIKRDEQKIRFIEQQLAFENEVRNLDEDEQNKRFWEGQSEHCPEMRNLISQKHNKCKNDKKTLSKEKPKQRKFFAPCGRPYNINQPKLKFLLTEEPDCYELDLSVYKFLDTSLIDVDVQPNYVRVTVKGKIFQLALGNEVRTSESTSKRFQTTGHLSVTMPKVCENKEIISGYKTKQDKQFSKNSDSNLKGTVNYKNIVKSSGKQSTKHSQNADQMEIPPLI